MDKFKIINISSTLKTPVIHILTYRGGGNLSNNQFSAVSINIFTVNPLIQININKYNMQYHAKIGIVQTIT